MESFKEDSDVFEITDFTTASDWERFIAALEEIFNDWKLANDSRRPPPLHKGDITSGVWSQETESVSFADFKFSVTRHTLSPRDSKSIKDLFEAPNEPSPVDSRSVEENDETPKPPAFADILNSSNDFPAKAHCLVRWYGIRDFVVLSCATPGETVSSESRVKILLSSINIAINNTGCTLPVFLEIDRAPRQIFFGVCEGSGMKLNFEVASLKRIPAHLRFMSGLVDLFLKKLGCSITHPPRISVALRFTYVINMWPAAFSPCVLEDEEEDDRIEYNRLRAGPLQDPISDLILATTWPLVDSIMVADSENYSDLDPMSAPQWHLRPAFVERPPCNLWETLRQFLKICRRPETMSDMFPTRVEDGASPPTFSRAIGRLTEHRIELPTLSSAVRQARSQLKRRWMENPPLSFGLVEELMEFIFTDEELHASAAHAADEEEKEKEGELRRAVAMAELDKALEKQLKCAPMTSLAHRLAVALACLIPQAGGLHAVAQLWQEVLEELRTRWQAGLYITNLGPDAAPDLGTSLFHQKLQMLNCCITKKIAGETADTTGDKKCQEEQEEEEEEEEEVESDEEFFECQETMSEPSPREPDGRPRGRKEPCGVLRLLQHPQEVLFVPFTQEAAPLTEDAVEEQTKRMSNLGTSAEAASLRARMQCASLVSDMEAFKAANPLCCLEDFVRWYSPRDFIADDNSPEGRLAGHLSARMEVPGNLWAEAWREARFIPARRQKRLFDETAEAEKVFRFLTDLSPGFLCQQLLPNVLAEALKELHRYHDPEIGPAEMPGVLESLLERAGLATRQPDAGLSCYEEVLRRLAHAEVLLVRAKSLEAKFLPAPAPGVDRQGLLAFVRQCLSDLPEVGLVGAARGPVGEVLQSLMLACQREESPEREEPAEEPGLRFPDPTGKEYILRSELARPSPNSRPAPQRLYCAVQKDDYRLCGAFAADTMFY